MITARNRICLKEDIPMIQRNNYMKYETKALTVDDSFRVPNTRFKYTNAYRK